MQVTKFDPADRLRWLAATVIVLAMAVPLLATPFPLLIDLLAHVARYHVERNLPFTRESSQFLTYSWRYLPSLGVDLSVVFLSQ